MPALSPTDRSHLELLKTYLLENHSNDLAAMLAADDVRRHYSVYAGCMALMDLSVEFGEALIDNPLKILSLMDMAASLAHQELYDQSSAKEKLCLKDHLHMRLVNLPHFIQTMSLPRCANVGKFQAISGTVLRTTTMKVLEYQKEHICGKCGYTFVVEANVQMYHFYSVPTLCPSETGCNGTRFTPTSGVTNLSHCRDYQEILVQEKLNNMVVGIMPGHMWVILEDDLVDTCKPGQDVLISGVVLVRQHRFSRGQRPDSSFVFRAHSVEVAQAQCTSTEVSAELRKEFEEFWQSHRQLPLVGRNKILCSVCPQVYGLFLVKLAVALVLAGGVRRTADNGTKIRGESHLLLVGDPGTAKSQFLKYASKISARSVLTTGIGSTSAGLTAAAVKDGCEWQLEAGALVLADGGLCCIDEFNSIREHDRGSIHEAMEQQTLSIAKAGIVSKLSTRCSVLAATNPKGSCSASGELDVNIGIASPLLSRFDLVLVLQDTRSEDWDRLVSSFLLSGHDPLQEHSNDGLWSISKMRSYLATIKALNPVLTDNAKSILQEYYQRQRRASERSAARTTLRLLESLIRLSQAHARLMFREEVTAQDAIVAVTLMESSMQRSALIQNIDTLHTSFAADPELDYKQQAKTILTELGLHEELRKELDCCCVDEPSPPHGTSGKTLQTHSAHAGDICTGKNEENPKHLSQPCSVGKENQTTVNQGSGIGKVLKLMNKNLASKQNPSYKAASEDTGVSVLEQTHNVHGSGNSNSAVSTHVPEHADETSNGHSTSTFHLEKSSPQRAGSKDKAANLKEMLKSFSFKRASPGQHKKEKTRNVISKDVSKLAQSGIIAHPVQNDQNDVAVKVPTPVPDCAPTTSKMLSAAEKLQRFRCIPREGTNNGCATSGPSNQGIKSVSSSSNGSSNASSNTKNSSVSVCARTSALTSNSETSKFQGLFNVGQALCSEEDIFDDLDWEIDLSVPFKRQKTT